MSERKPPRKFYAYTNSADDSLPVSSPETAGQIAHIPPQDFFHLRNLNPRTGNHSTLIAVLARFEPAADLVDHHFDELGLKRVPTVFIEPGTKEGEEALHWEVKTPLDNEQATRWRVAWVVGGMCTYLNLWNNPQAYFDIKYSDPDPVPEQPPAALAAPTPLPPYKPGFYRFRG